MDRLKCICTDVILPCWRELHAGFPVDGLQYRAKKGSLVGSGSLEPSDGFNVFGKWQEIECGERGEA